MSARSPPGFHTNFIPIAAWVPYFDDGECGAELNPQFLTAI